MSLEWIEYQQMICDAPGCRATEARGIGDERDLPKDFPAWTFVRATWHPAWIEGHFCPVHKAEGEAAQRKVTEAARG